MNKSLYAILGVLSLKPCSGYEIKKLMSESTAYFWSESDGSIYPALRELNRQEMVACDSESVGKRERKIYSITTKGKKELARWLNEPAEAQKPRNELLLKLFFAEQMPISVVRKHLENHQRDLLAKFEVYVSIRRKLEQEYNSDAAQPFWLMTLRNGELSVSAGLQWCEEAFSILDQWKKWR